MMGLSHSASFPDDRRIDHSFFFFSQPDGRLSLGLVAHRVLGDGLRPRLYSF